MVTTVAMVIWTFIAPHFTVEAQRLISKVLEYNRTRYMLLLFKFIGVYHSFVNIYAKTGRY